MTNRLSGLTTQEVSQRIDQEQVNTFKAKTGSSNWEIFVANVFTPFNLLNLLIFLALVAVNSWANTFFFGIIILNSASGMLTEWRAKRTIDKLNLINKEKIQVIRDGQQQAIDPDDIVLDDLLLLSAGDQIPSDAKVVSGFAEVNEAMLTGESDLIQKEADSQLLSGSYLVSGQVYAQVTHVGADNYANQLMVAAKAHKPITSRILASMDRLANVTGKIILPFGLALFIESYILAKLPLEDSVVRTSTALLGMLPKGIALLTITSLLTAVIKLGLQNVLVQEMYSVETLARVDVLCLDKTGTITQGKMTVDALQPLDDAYQKESLAKLLSVYMQASDDQNSTAQAIRRAYAHLPHDYQVSKTIPFSSGRKWGAVQVDQVGTLVLGAPEMLLDCIPASVQDAQSRGSRVLILALSQNAISTTTIQLPTDLSPLALLEITDPIREGAAETLDYLRSQDVLLKIISGDNPITVSHIAKEAGFMDYDNFVDCSKLSDDQLVELAETTAIFGRVSPHQKKLLIKTLKSKGHTTAMTGDGVNDILALREADCSIVMAEGDPATRQIANLVLLDSEFNDIPEILFEGRRVVNNIAHIAPIFLIKTIYSFLIGLLCITTILLGKPEYLLIFPFIQVQMTLQGQFIEGLPPFLLTFERNIRPVHQHFLKRALKLALPNAVLLVLAVILFYSMRLAGLISQPDLLSLSYYVLGATGVMAVIRACFPLSKIRIALIIYSVFGFFISSHYLYWIIQIDPLNNQTLPIFILVLAIIAPVYFWISYRQDRIKD